MVVATPAPQAANGSSSQQPGMASLSDSTTAATAGTSSESQPTSSQVPEEKKSQGELATGSADASDDALKREADAVAAATPPSVAQTLQAQIDALTEFSTTLRALRQSPVALLKSGSSQQSLPVIPGVDGLPPFGLVQTTRQVLGDVAAARTRLLAEQVQGALKAAGESEKKDRSGIRGGLRREIRKRKYVCEESLSKFMAFL
jgi:hypothetical protein